MNEFESLELKISKFLRGGVIFAGLIMLAGYVMQFKFSGDPFFNFQTYDQISFEQLLRFHYSIGQWGALVSYAGLLVLISLPLIRVALTTLLFLKQKDFSLALIAGTVLLALIVSMTLGIEL